eukprot:TRINITY_DN67222_c3_g1_i2.p2 TRINITY_DN67222_c3_g1~~TRINITY_DN67222_c3_g1_i2.p2  ORF type:complete len:339 (+),score=30.85 TRINITY_DN67222_c3_g1_i2:71-1087(+)
MPKRKDPGALKVIDDDVFVAPNAVDEFAQPAKKKMKKKRTPTEPETPRSTRQELSPSPEPQESRDLSPPRRERDLSPPRRRGGNRSPSPPTSTRDLSPPRRARDRDLSPPRRSRHSSPPPKERPRSQPEAKHKGRDKRGKEEVPSQPKDKVSRDEAEMGKGASTIYRKKGSGKKYDPVAEAKAESAEKDKEPSEQQKKLSKGLVQVAANDKERDEMIKSLKDNFGQAPGSSDLDSRLRAVQHWDDPMRGKLGMFGDGEDAVGHIHLTKEQKKLKEKMRIKNEVKKKFTYQGGFPPNRFMIRPGYRWDSKDRSNGYEKRIWAMKQEQRDNRQTQSVVDG